MARPGSIEGGATGPALQPSHSLSLLSSPRRPLLTRRPPLPVRLAVGTPRPRTLVAQAGAAAAATSAAPKTTASIPPLLAGKPLLPAALTPSGQAGTSAFGAPLAGCELPLGATLVDGLEVRRRKAESFSHASGSSIFLSLSPSPLTLISFHLLPERRQLCDHFCRRLRYHPVPLHPGRPGRRPHHPRNRPGPGHQPDG